MILMKKWLQFIEKMKKKIQNIMIKNKYNYNNNQNKI